MVLLDLEMPGMDGVTRIPPSRCRPPRTPRVLVFTAYDTDERVLGAVRAGARGYLLKGAERRGDRARHPHRPRAAARTWSRAWRARARLLAESARHGATAR